MLILKESASSISLTGDLAEIKLLDDRLKFRPPNYFMSESYKIYQRTKNTNFPKGWDGWKRIFKIKGNQAIAYRGLLTKILDEAEILEITIDTSQRLTSPFTGITEDDISDDLITGDLDEAHWQLQRRCLVSWLQNGICRLKVTVSGGKTALFCAAAAKIKQHNPAARFLYMTPTERLVKQVYNESRKFLPDWDITQYGGGKRDNSGNDMVVVTGAILSRNFKKLLFSGWFKTFTGILVDESQYAASPTWSKVISATPAFYKLGASDSSKEEDPIKDYMITGLLGPIVNGIEAAPLIALNRIATPKIHVVDNLQWKGKFDHLRHVAELDSDAWILLDGAWKKGIYKGPVFQIDADGELIVDKKGEFIQVPNYHSIELDGVEHEIESRYCLLKRKYDESIIRFKERNTQITEWAKFYTDQTFPTLVIATRTMHVLILESMISKLVPNTRMLFSMSSSDERDETIDWFRSTPGSVLITPLVKVGVSINEIKAGIIADYVGDWEYANQLVGRMIRKKFEGDNDAHLTWFVERQHKSYSKGSREVLHRLSQIEGYQFYENQVPALTGLPWIG